MNFIDKVLKRSDPEFESMIFGGHFARLQLPDQQREYKGSCFIYGTSKGKTKLTIQNQFGIENFIDEVSLSQDPKVAFCEGLMEKGYFIEFSTL